MIIDNLPHLIQIKAAWHPNDQQNGLIDLMSRETNLTKVTFANEFRYYKYSRDQYNILRDLIHPKWILEGEAGDSMAEITFIQND